MKTTTVSKTHWLYFGAALHFIFFIGIWKAQAESQGLDLLPWASLPEASFSSQVEWVTFVLLIALIISTVGLAIWSFAAQRPTRELLKLGLDASVRNLFLPIHVHEQENSQELSGFLRSIGLRYASLVITKKYVKGDILVFDLSSLPDFNEEDVHLNATVLRCVSLGGDPASFLLEVRFYAMPDKVRTKLASYIYELTKRRHYAY